MKYYFDASALVKRFKPERGYETVRKTIYEASVGTHEIHSIYWVKAEFYVAMRRGNVPQKLAARNLRALGKIIIFNPVTSGIVDDALNLIYDLNLHAADAIHLASCINLACEAILTDDEHMLSEDVKTYLEKHAVKLVNLKENP
ncbi:MAG: type II toxin-antitoxin system VapC family toxin [Candidatus Bathyarchaeia archaeon]